MKKAKLSKSGLRFVCVIVLIIIVAFAVIAVATDGLHSSSQNAQQNERILTGTWEMNKTIARPDFVSDGVSFKQNLAFELPNNHLELSNGWFSIEIVDVSMIYGEGEFQVIFENEDTGGFYVYSTKNAAGYDREEGWIGERFQTISFASERHVSAAFYDWFTANATKVG